MDREDKIWQDEKLIQTLKDGGVVIMPTDTVYGFVSMAGNPTAVSRVYTIRKRSTEKPCIILISDMNDVEKFGVSLGEAERETIRKYWPGPVSISIPCLEEKLAYLHRGTNSLAFRVPLLPGLQSLLREVGPIIAPSANPEGMPGAKNIEEARQYFGDLVDMYVDGGTIVSAPSKIIKVGKDGTETVLRE